jgi:outer membrane protein assembly factor BamB
MKFPHEPIETVSINGKVIVVYKWDELSKSSQPKISENVQCFDELGRLLWTVSGMENDPYWSKKSNMFVGVKLRDEGLYLISFRGSSYTLDAETGEVSFSEYHK